jgi:hypothetical protein
MEKRCNDTFGATVAMLPGLMTQFRRSKLLFPGIRAKNQT